MLTVRSINVKNADGYAIVVGFQPDDARPYNSLEVELSPDQAREVVDLIISSAVARLTTDPAKIKIAGEPVTLPLIEEEDPEFAEVEEAPPPPDAPAAHLLIETPDKETL